MILNDLDLGSAHPFLAPDAGQTTGAMQVEGGRTIVWARGMKGNDHRASLWAKAWQAIGGQTALTVNASRYLLRQAEELANNPDLNPVYIRWQASADPAAVLNVDDQHDGWYVITSLVPDYDKISSGLIPVKMTARLVVSGVPRPQAVWYSGGALASNFSGGSQTAIGYPLNAAGWAASIVTRPGAEGNALLSIAPPANYNPILFAPSATVGDWFKGGCRAYDTLVAGGNAVPATGLANANWVEAKHPDHRFEGDCIITNGLHLYRFQTGVAAQLCLSYVWSTAQVTPGWLQFAAVALQDNTGGNAILRGFELLRVGLEEVSLKAMSSTGNGIGMETVFRLGRGMYFARVDLRPLAQANTTTQSLFMSVAANPKIVYNSGSATDNLVGAANPTVQPDYGYAACFVTASSQPFICGWLYQNQPSPVQPQVNTVGPGLGDSSGPAQNAVRSYGIFAMPYGSNGASTEKLQAEAESGSLASGWTSQANASASNGNEAKCANLTPSPNPATWGTAFVPQAGTYDLWVRMKVTSAASGVAQMQVGLFDATSTAFVSSTTYAPSSLTTSYAWYRVAAGATPTAGHLMQARAITTATLTTDFFMDESALVPLTLSTANTGPQELFQQFLHDRAAKIVRVA